MSIIKQDYGEVGGNAMILYDNGIGTDNFSISGWTAQNGYSISSPTFYSNYAEILAPNFYYALLASNNPITGDMISKFKGIYFVYENASTDGYAGFGVNTDKYIRDASILNKAWTPITASSGVVGIPLSSDMIGCYFAAATINGNRKIDIKRVFLI